LLSLNRTWSQWCRAELGISDDTANRLIETYEATILDLQRLALAKLARALRADGLPPHLAGAVCRLIDDPQPPELF
jgi:hypothetical protein